MDAATTVRGRLATLDAAALAQLLGNRPDALIAPQPRSLDELAERLDRPESVAAALHTVPAPCIQLTEASLALGGAPTLATLTALLAESSSHHDEDVRRWLQVLADRAIAWPTADGAIAGSGALTMIFPDALGLGSPLRALLAPMPVDGMRRILRTLGAAKIASRRAEVLEELLAVLTDPETVRGIAATAPGAVTQELAAWAREGESDEYEVFGRTYDRSASQRRSAAAGWALERGLVFGHSWSYGWQMPAEVSRALRGPDFRAPFAAAVSRFAELVLAAVDRLDRVRMPSLKSGGVGARELAKLGKAVACDEHEIRLVLELCAAVGVIEEGFDGWELSDDAEQWRSLPPAERIGALVRAWWDLPFAPSESRDADGKSVAALTARVCQGCRVARQNLLLTIADLGPGRAAARGQLAARAMWRRPFVHVLAQDEDHAFDSIFTEAATVGVLAAGALTPLGSALIAGDEASVRDLLAAALPASNDSALFGVDLTVVVTGAPAAAVSRLLDASADRESRGGATVWRFTQASIRRALDEGHSARGLEEALAGIATGQLPQALCYLIGDVGRRHGNLTVGTAVSVVRSEDEALLKQAVGDRALRKLGLRLIAPTVLGADADPATVLTALRGAGYLPMPEGGATAAAAPSREQPRAFPARSRAARPAPARSDPHELAARLLAPPAAKATSASRTELALSGANRALSTSEIRMLAHAVDSSSSVAIAYRASSGNTTRRVISAPEMDGDVIIAWCELRADERWFRVERIQAVFPAGA